MKEIIIKDLILSYDDDFKLLGEEETDQMKFYNDSKGICIKDDNRRMIVTIGFKNVNLLTNFILFNKDLVNKTQSDISTAMKAYDYKLIGNINALADGREIDGFNYEYVAEGIEMYGEVFVFKKDKTIYYLYLYSRKDNLNNNLEIWKEIINNLRWKE